MPDRKALAPAERLRQGLRPGLEGDGSGAPARIPAANGVAHVQWNMNTAAG
jgi:hypothetical protein